MLVIFSSFVCILLLLLARSIYSPQRSIPKHPESMFLTERKHQGIVLPVK
jgi:hypothetical protein